MAARNSGGTNTGQAQGIAGASGQARGAARTRSSGGNGNATPRGQTTNALGRAGQTYTALDRVKSACIAAQSAGVPKSEIAGFVQHGMKRGW